MRNNVEKTTIEVLDGQLMSEEAVFKRIKKIKPDILGFNVIIGQPLRSAHDLTRVAHTLNPQGRIIWGGPVARISPQFAPKHIEVDPEYYDSQPAWDLLKSPEKYEHAIFTSRGCPFQCGFCFHRKDDKLRTEPVETVIAQMQYLKRNFGWRDFKIMDDNFFTHTERAIKIMEAMKKNDFFIKQAHSHANSFTPELIKYLDLTIVDKLGISIEHGDQKIVDKLGKNLSLEKTLPKIEALGRKGIKTIHNFIFGLPFGQDDTKNFEVMTHIKRLNGRSRGVGFVYAPMPETPLIRQIERQYGDYPNTLEFWEDFDMAVINKKYNKWLTKVEILETQRMADDFNREFGEWK